MMLLLTRAYSLQQPNVALQQLLARRRLAAHLEEQAMPVLSDTFRSPECRVTRAVVAIDLTNSTSLKELTAEANWLNSYGWFFDRLAETISQFTSGRIVKYLGDGAMAIFGEDSPHEAINWAIAVQERIAKARERNEVDLTCSVGISYGEMVEFEDPQATPDYIGSIVDRAFRLCSAANANGIFVDSDTISAAMMTRVTSTFGRSSIPRRSVAEYQGSEELWRAKGFSQAIHYYEIIWSNARYGVRSESVSQEVALPPRTTVQPTQPAPPVAPPQPPVEAGAWRRGVVKTPINDRGFGFISSNGVDFFFASNLLYSPALVPDIAVDVLFSPLPPIRPGTAPRASFVVPLGATVQSRLERVLPEGYGFAPLRAFNGEVRSVFVNLRDSSQWSVGDEVQFRIGVNPKGLAGIDTMPVAPLTNGPTT